MNDIEHFVNELLLDIEKAGLNNENFDLHLEACVTKEMSEEIEKLEWIEIY